MYAGASHLTRSNLHVWLRAAWLLHTRLGVLMPVCRSCLQSPAVRSYHRHQVYSLIHNDYYKGKRIEHHRTCAVMGAITDSVLHALCH